MASGKASDVKFFSADSHVVEPGHCFIDNIEKKYRETAPRIVKNAKGGETYLINGAPIPYPVAGAASAGGDLAKADFEAMTVAEVNPGAFDPKERLIAQDKDNVEGEILYPSIGMLVCGDPDPDYRNACMHAYNRWLQEFISYAPERLVGIGQTAVRSVHEAIDDLRRIKEMGFKGVMLPAEPSTEQDYDDPYFDPLWQASVELQLPVSFHVATSSIKRNAFLGSEKYWRGPKANMFQDLIRVNQDIVGLFIWGQVFERNPDLKVVCVEADASWAPHYMLRMNHYYVDRPDMKFKGMSELPSEYFLKNVYLTFQNDWVTFDLIHRLNPDNLLWANDFPHPDACWPHSQALLDEHCADLEPKVRTNMVRDNVKRLYKLMDC